MCILEVFENKCGEKRNYENNICKWKHIGGLNVSPSDRRNRLSTHHSQSLLLFWWIVPYLNHHPALMVAPPLVETSSKRPSLKPLCHLCGLISLSLLGLRFSNYVIGSIFVFFVVMFFVVYLIVNVTFRIFKFVSAVFI